MMMMNLFSMFDPATSKYLNLNWLILFCPLFLLYKIYFFKKNRILYIITFPFNHVTNDVKSNTRPLLHMNMFFMLLLFLLIMSTNFISLYPFIFTFNSHISSSLFLSLPFWLSLMIKSFFKSFNQTLAHMVPKGTPLFLSFFMVVIETFSNFIRPLTLSIRLTTNMLAGHILIYLLSQTLNSVLLIFLGMSLITNILIILEMMVSLIQAYVFVILISLYMNEA